MLKHEIPYQTNSAELFAKIAEWPWAVFLDSGQPMSQFGRYDIMAANPFVRLVTNGEQTVIVDGMGERSSKNDPFELLKETLSPYRIAKTELPFEGGAIGYFAYDLARRVEHLPSVSLDAENMPQMVVGIYDWALVVDHQLRRTYLVSHGMNGETEVDWPSLCAIFDGPLMQATQADFKISSALQSNMDYTQYGAAFNRVKQYIHEGDCYQVNLAQRFSAHASGDAWTAYLALRDISPAPFMSYMNLGDAQSSLQVLSASPERFLQVHGKHVETRPIKGTRPRSDNAVEDASNANDLQNSPKDCAENLMIVDLLRNDISKVCETGSVRADKLFALESFANVHHLVSTVTGKLAEDKTAIDLLRACFPGGSITGAPKFRAMEIIEELEPNRRGLYCGAIGYVGFDGNMDTNIAIRTAVYSDDEIRFYAGGGVVADSELAKEYRETLDKASSMLELIARFGGDVSLKASRS
ncbi:MAG: aminodeoxychorismate synthase component I [Burkholderiaceae bacterium]|nr:aminodeoxychorismate synthase component I [Burkholderiaceae bacterium]